jgi:hypothetical protein
MPANLTLTALGTHDQMLAMPETASVKIERHDLEHV